MQRRRVLAGLAAGMALFAGCGGNGGGGNGGGNNTTEPSSGAGTPLDPATPTTSTPAMTTIAETTRETATQTATATPTPTATPTATPMPTAGPTEAGTAELGTATGSMDIDLSERETYENDDYAYTVEYPTEWNVDDSDPTSVSFTASASPSTMTVLAQEGAASSSTLDQAAENFLTGYQQSAGEEGGSTEILNQEDVTLPNDHPGRLFDFRLSSSGVSVRQKAVITLVDDTMYAGTIVIPEGIYTSSVGEQADEILTSLTVSGGSTTTTSS